MKKNEQLIARIMWRRESDNQFEIGHFGNVVGTKEQIETYAEKESHGREFSIVYLDKVSSFFAEQNRVLYFGNK